MKNSLNGNFIKEWQSARDACRALNVQPMGISDCCNNKSKKHKNYIWKFKKQETNGNV